MAKFHQDLEYHKDTKEKRSLTKEDIGFLKSFQKERNTQDTCGMADVRTWVIRDREDMVTEEGYEDYYVLYNSENYNNLDLEDMYQILKALELETDYYSGDIIIKDLNFKNNTITFKYFGRKSSISNDNNNEDAFIINGICIGELISFFNDNGYDIVRVNMRVNWVHKFCFLTEKAAREYLMQNSHNHSVDAHTYCICTYKDPELKKIMDILESVSWSELSEKI